LLICLLIGVIYREKQIVKTMSKLICVIGSANTDMVVKVKHLPSPGETIIGGTFLMNAGGKGANQAVAAARSGGNVSFVASLGDDVFGQESMKQLRAENISTGFVHIDKDHPSGIALIYVDDKGENSIVVAPGANSQLNSEHAEAALRSLKESSIILIQLEIPIETVTHAIREAHTRGHQIILNPAPASNIDDELYPMLYMITPNESEAELLTGIRVEDGISARQAAAALHLKGVPQVVITMGSKGAFVSTSRIQKLIPAPAVKALDTTAAGDCFNGALAVALAEGKELEEAVEVACHAASISVMRMGAQSSMPSREEINTSMNKKFTTN
jgi:ribokinase